MTAAGPAEDDGGFCGGSAVVEGALRFHRQDRRGGILLRRRDRQRFGSADGRGSRSRPQLFRGGQPPAADVPKIKAAMLLHYASMDTRLTAGWLAYEEELKANQVNYTGYVYEGAQHGFHNDTTPL